ncbi:unnamed protein product [Cylicocyclus nassatus]|uniref:Uncharacterized protein n=1 Tax=Cylicocyclus nassatus TaxID=53992 RepID=A0AA36HC27_CYLNA|nr:unnamed protein product [Cylicocyclus nassatus]
MKEDRRAMAAARNCNNSQFRAITSDAACQDQGVAGPLPEGVAVLRQWSANLIGVKLYKNRFLEPFSGVTFEVKLLSTYTS